MSGAKIGETIAQSRPHWPTPAQPPQDAPNILLVLFDDVAFSDFGCYGSPIRTPTIDALAAGGLRYSGFHTTAMCSTTRAALLTGRNHHAVGVGCLANFDSGYPGYRGKIAKEAGTIAEMLRPHGYRNYMIGKWHVTPLTESGATGPFDGWPLARGFDKFYGFLDAETDQFAPELVQDNSPVPPPGTFETGYHLTEDLVDRTIRMIADHAADRPDLPWFSFLALGACHAPHQAPRDLILEYDALFQDGWDAERDRRLARQKAIGLVPQNTKLPPRNDFVRPWADLSEPEKIVNRRLQGAYAAMLDHADQHLARLIDFLDRSGQRDNTLILVLSDNGASQEGGPFGMVNAMGPFNFRIEPVTEKLERLDEIGGPKSHSNFPLGWAMAANTPLRRYKQNTHGGGVRDPLVINWPARIREAGAIRPHFAHVSDLAPTLLDLFNLAPPAQINGVAQMPLTGVSFKESLFSADAPARAKPQYFEMFGHRGLWRDGWKAVAFHPPGKPFEQDEWELFHLDADFSEADNLAAAFPERLADMIAHWRREAEANQVFPLDDRFGQRFAENAARYHGARRKFVFHKGVGHVPTDVAPDVRSRSYSIEADVEMPRDGAEGVLIAHGDATSGYTLYVKGGRLFHSLNIGGHLVTVQSDRPVPEGDCALGLRVRRLSRIVPPRFGEGQGETQYELLIDGAPAGAVKTPLGFVTLISWSGLDIGLDRGSAVGAYAAPFAFTGLLRKVTVVMDDDQKLDGEAVAAAEMARQ